MATQANSLDSLLKLIQTFSGSSETETTSGGTTTKQTILDQSTMNAILKSALEGNQGLASVASGERAAGMYNSTVGTQLTNDLLARLTTQATIAGAPTVTTTPKTTVAKATPGVGMSGVGAIGALSLGKNLLDSTLGTNGKKSLLDIITGEKDANASVDIGKIGAFGETAMATPAGDIQNISAADLTDYWNAAEASGTMVPDLGGAAGMEAIKAFSESIGATGDYELGDVLTATDVGGTVADAVSGGDYDYTGWTEDCFLTTAVCKYQGKHDQCYELTVLRNFRDGWLKENHPEDIDTYYAEAPAIVKKIEAMPTPGWIFDRMYSTYILPAIQHIEEGNNAAAYQIYKHLYRFCEAL